jgi:hypothetical protein
MANSLDLNVLPITGQAGQDFSELPGFYLANRPRRAVRSRKSDQLILFVETFGGTTFTHASQNNILADLAKIYFKASGSVTSALREVAESFNKYLINLNAREGVNNQVVTGALTQILRRGEQLYIALSGPMNIYFLHKDGCESIYEPKLAGNGLGRNKDTAIQYFYAALAANDTLIVDTDISQGLNVNDLTRLYGQGPESMRRNLFARSAKNARALIIQVKPGKGDIQMLHSLSKPAVKPYSSQLKDSQRESPPNGSDSGSVNVTQPMVSEEPAAKDAVQGVGGAAVKIGDKVGSRDQTLEFRPQTSSPKNKFLTILLAPIKILLLPFSFVLNGFSSLLNRILPGETLASIPNSTMALLALVLPLIIVGIATGVYIQRGVAVQSQVVYDQARDLARQAENETDILAQRTAWVALLDHLDKAETLYSDPELLALHDKAQHALDRLDMIVRTDYQPAIFGGLPASVNVTRIILGDGELYLLDGNNGSVYRATLTDQGYIVDETFQCGPGYPGVDEPLIDIVAWPAGFDPSASILGTDAKGGVVYCQAGELPKTDQLLEPAGIDINEITVVTMDLGNLYILDPDQEQVWVYWNADFTQPPAAFFGDDVPPLDDINDIMVNNNELYLLHEDGHLTLCQYGAYSVSPTRCIDPLPYIDTRPGRENTVYYPEYPFSEILYNQPPDPSLYLLQPATRSIMHFSLRNPTFQRQYMPLEENIQGLATAFAVDVFDRLFFMAAGNDVYYAPIP